MIEKLDYVKAKRYLLSSKWKEGIPCFLCGAGKKAEFYSRLFGEMQDNPNPHLIAVRNLPEPINLEAGQIPEDSYDRISVSYGLSHDPLDIGEIVKEGDVEDISIDGPTPPTGTAEVVVAVGGFPGEGCTFIRRSVFQFGNEPERMKMWSWFRAERGLGLASSSP